MRVPKFRAWDKSVGHLYEVQTLIDGGDAIGRYVLNGEMRYIHLCADEIIVEQYTGLKDKNGKEIYEGDIVEEDIDFSSKMTDGTFRYRVYWDECLLCWSLDPIGREESIHDELWQTNLSRRIIGNVHKNSDLLGDTDVTNKEEE